MGAAEVTVAVCVEEALHKGLRETIQAVYAQHGIRIVGVTVQWGCVPDLMATYPASSARRIESVRIETES